MGNHTLWRAAQAENQLSDTALEGEYGSLRETMKPPPSSVVRTTCSKFHPQMPQYGFFKCGLPHRVFIFAQISFHLFLASLSVSFTYSRGKNNAFKNVLLPPKCFVEYLSSKQASDSSNVTFQGALGFIGLSPFMQFYKISHHFNTPW